MTFVEKSLKTDSHPPKKFILLASVPFKNDEKCFSFHLKSSLRSQYIEIALTFLV